MAPPSVMRMRETPASAGTSSSFLETTKTSIGSALPWCCSSDDGGGVGICWTRGGDDGDES
jgi:hypothetical protein